MAGMTPRRHLPTRIGNRTMSWLLTQLVVLIICGSAWAFTPDSSQKAEVSPFSGSRTDAQGTVEHTEGGEPPSTTTVSSHRDVEYLILQGDRQYRSCEYDDAIETYQAALKLCPDRPGLLKKLADTHMAAGRDDEALATYRSMLNLEPNNPAIHYSMGRILERRGSLAEAEVEYRKSLNDTSHSGDVRRRLADIYTLRGDYPLAIEEYKELLKLPGDNPLLHFKLARAFEKNRDYANSIKEYQAAIRQAPDNLEARRELAALYRWKNMGDKSAEQYREVLRQKKDDLNARSTLASLYVKLKKFDDLYALMKEGIELFPNDPDSHYKLGVMHEFRGEYDAAIEQYEKTISLKGDHTRALISLGRIYIQKGEPKKAKPLLEAAQRIAPNYAEARRLQRRLIFAEKLMSRARGSDVVHSRRKAAPRATLTRRKSFTKKKTVEKRRVRQKRR